MIATDNPLRTADRRGLVAVVIAALVVVATGWWGRHLADRGVELLVDAAPLVGTWERIPSSTSMELAIVALLIAVAWPVLGRRLPWHGLLAASWGVSLMWSGTLARAGGLRHFWEPFTTGFEYLPLARRVDDVGIFIATFARELPSYPTHVRGHPPGPVVGFVALDRLALDNETIGLVVFAVAALAAPAVAVAVRAAVDVAAARRVAIFTSVLPSAIWASSFDAALTGIAAVATAFIATAMFRPSRLAHLTRVVASVLGGLLVGVVVVSTYGAPTLLMPAVTVIGWGLWNHRREALVPTTAIAVCALTPLVALLANGFWWFDGFSATRQEYVAGAGGSRPLNYFLVANVAVLAVAVGPAVVAGFTRVRWTRQWLLPVAALCGAMAANVSGFSKGEVERIWLPLVPWLAVAVLGLGAGERRLRWWLSAQLAVGVALQSWLVSPW